MDVDVVHGATTEQEKELYCRKGLYFECQGIGHMAHYCPKKEQKQRQQQSQGFKLKTYNKQYKSFNNCKPTQCFGQQKHFNKPRAPFARLAQFLDSDNKDDKEITLVNSVNTSKSGNTELNISDIVARTACFSDTQREEWVKEMKNLRVDF